MNKFLIFLRRLGRALQPFFFLFTIGRALILWAILPAILLVCWPYIPDRYKPEWLVSALGFLSPAPYLSWETLRAAAFAVISLVAALHLLSRLRLRRERGRANSLLPRVLDHGYGNGFIRDHIELKKAILDAATQPPPRMALAAQVPLVPPHLDRMCRQITAIFEEITGCRCHCTIKIYNKDNNMVSTMARDDLPHNAGRRRVDDNKPVFDYRDNTAFRDVLENSNVDCYINNDLVAARRNKQYDNSNPHWDKHYNSTAVAPITYSLTARTIDRDRCIGFITVDSMLATFDPRTSIAVLMPYSAILYDFLSLLGKQHP